MMRKFLVFMPLVVLLAMAALFFSGLKRDNPQALHSVMVGKSSPAFKLTAIGTIPLLTDQALREGHPVLVNFFASWCEPCRAEHAQLMALANQYHIKVYGIAWKDTPDAAQKFLTIYGNPYAGAGADIPGHVGIDWGVAGVPESFIVRGDGVIFHRHWGDIRAEHIEESILPKLKEAGE